MNSVSWFLYGADVAASIKTAAQGTIIAIVVVGGFAGVFSPLIMMSADDIGLNVTAAQVWKVIKSVATALVLAVFVAIIVPSQNTLYAIAASQVGERIVKSETVQGMASDATKALQQWIKRQIEPETKK